MKGLAKEKREKDFGDIFTYIRMCISAYDVIWRIVFR